MEKVVYLNTSRDCYDKREAMESSISVKELINILEDVPEDAKVIFSNDGGYTYGYIDDTKIHYDTIESKEEEELREKIEDVESDLYDLLTERNVLWSRKDNWDDEDKEDWARVEREIPRIKAQLSELKLQRRTI